MVITKALRMIIAFILYDLLKISEKSCSKQRRKLQIILGSLVCKVMVHGCHEYILCSIFLPESGVVQLHSWRRRTMQVFYFMTRSHRMKTAGRQATTAQIATYRW